MATPYEALLPEVLPYVPDCPELVAVNAVRNACIEFAEQTDFVRYVMDPITTRPFVGTYDLDLPSGTVLGRIIQAFHDDFPLKPITEDLAESISPGGDWRQNTGNPRYILQMDDPAQVIITPMPQERHVGGLKLIVSLKPSRDSTTCDDQLRERFAEDIAAGAIARLYSIKGQPYYDPQAAVIYRAKFVAAMGKAKRERSRALGRPVMAMRPARGAF